MFGMFHIATAVSNETGREPQPLAPFHPVEGDDRDSFRNTISYKTCIGSDWPFWICSRQNFGLGDFCIRFQNISTTEIQFPENEVRSFHIQTLEITKERLMLSCRDVAMASLGEPHHASAGELYYHCPNHDDAHPSLKISERKDCFLCGPCGVGGNGWRLAAFLSHLEPNEKKAIGLWLMEHGLGNSNGHKVPPKEKPSPSDFHEVASFYYTPTLRNVRYETTPLNGEKPAKKFQFQRFENGSWIPGAGGQTKPLYMNALLREADEVGYAVGFEGEGKCEAANKIGIPGFSYKHMQASECSKLADLNIILWPDADSPGEKQAKVAAKMLLDSGQPASIRIIVPPLDLPLSGDIVDAVNIGWTKEQCDALIVDATEYPPKPEPLTIRLSDVSPESVTWIWRNRLPGGAITLLDGDPGTGKSMMAVDIAARISSGTALPGENNTNPANVVFLSSEDSLSQTLIPRLKSAGANLSRIVTIPYIPEKPGQQTFSRIPRDLEMLGTVIEEEKAKLVVFDVLVSYIPAELSTQRDQDVRLALSPLSALANRTGVSFLATRHLNKNTATPAIYRGGGSIAITGAARCSLLLARDPANPDNRVLAVVKSNLGVIPPSIGMTITSENGIPKVQWIGESDQSADSLLSSQIQTPDSRIDSVVLSSAMDYLEEALKDGPMQANEVMTEARNQCIGVRTLNKAKASLNIKSYRVGAGPWYWEIKRPK